MKNVSGKVILRFLIFFSLVNRAVYEINVEKYGTARQIKDKTVIRRRKDAICMPGT
jgi:hypothetical protein